MWNLSNAAKESSLLGHVIQQSLPKSFPWQRWDLTHAPEETGALIQRLRPLGHATPLSMCFMGRFDWELSGPMQILLKSCSLILFTYDKTDPKRVSACGCVAVTTSLRCIWKNRSTQNWLKLSATEPQAVNKSHRKDVAPGAGLSYPALARRTLICGRGQGILV